MVELRYPLIVFLLIVVHFSKIFAPCCTESRRSCTSKLFSFDVQPHVRKR
ncbi:hypothetical protein HMPREF9163_02042 [Selenomonas sp. oral taxon 138 str. F0429]|nr:hypothetical protein HMPREF9163_02042 [Selenomonas sp. oral taxon 138 str. F0429]